MTPAEIASLFKESAERIRCDNLHCGHKLVCKVCGDYGDTLAEITHLPHCIVTRLRKAAEDVERQSQAIADFMAGDDDLAAAEKRRMDESQGETT